MGECNFSMHFCLHGRCIVLEFTFMCTISHNCSTVLIENIKQPSAICLFGWLLYMLKVVNSRMLANPSVWRGHRRRVLEFHCFILLFELCYVVSLSGASSEDARYYLPLQCWLFVLFHAMISCSTLFFRTSWILHITLLSLCSLSLLLFFFSGDILLGVESFLVLRHCYLLWCS